MKKKTYIQNYLHLIIAALILSLNSYAETPLPNHYPKSFDSTGIVNSVNSRNHTIVLTGSKLTTSPLVTVHTLKKNTILFPQLTAGTKVGVIMDKTPGKNTQVRHLWILPDDYSAIEYVM